MAEVAEAEFNIGAKGKKQLVDNKMDSMFRGSKVDNYFKVSQRGSNLTTEIRAGITTFLTAAYIMAVNPNILSTTGLKFEGLVFATAGSSCIATLIMALWANLPFGLWPGMGMNAYFAYTIVGFKGGQNSVKKVMFAVTIEGVIFILMSLFDLRRYVFKVFPTWMMKATMAGIGLFLAFIGLQAGNGIDIVRDHPAVLVDLVTLTGEHFLRTWIGIAFFCLMSLLILLRVRAAVMIVILLSAILSWILNAAAVEQFTYKPMCCLGSVSYTEPSAGGVEWYPKPGGGFYPKPTCENPYTVPGEGKMEETDSGVSFSWDSTASVALSNGVYTITNGGSSVNHTGSLYFQGIAAGRDSSFNGGCTDTCHAMMGGFNPACFGTVLVETGCWTSMSYQSRATQSLVLDEFGEGCIGGAGRIPKTFSAPSAIASVPLIEMAGDLVAPFDGWYGCDANGDCFAGDVSGGTILAWDTSGFSDWQGFWNPLLTLLYIDFIGTMGFLYAAADLSGLVDPKKPETFPGCYAAFMADAVGTFVGGFLGTSSVTTYGESMAGVYEGGRTGLTALVIAFMNFICIFLTPLLSSVPTLSTGPALVMVGVFMIEGVKDIDWTDYMQAIPSTICILLQITTYKIEVGVLGALMVWAFLMIFSGRVFLYNDKVWNSMPGWFQNFVANQNGDEEFRNRLREVGKLPPADEKMPAEMQA
ncbi:AZG1 [Symbiodinium sp. CCMP2592]|nr:AZG1 [Symbiodinium sp. CCMP2592]